MNTVTDGGPAFPGFAHTNGRGNTRRNEQSGEWETYEQGMSLRAWLAGQALAGTVASYAGMPVKDQLALVEKAGGTKAFAKTVGQTAVLYADATLAALETPK